MKKIFFKQIPCLFVSVLLYTASNAQPGPIDQYAVTSMGNSTTAIGATGTTMSFTVGEIVITTGGTNPFFTQGIQQPTSTGFALPVRLLSLTAIAQGNKGFLNWVTATEINNSKFVVERSMNGTDFTPIGTVASKAVNGNSNAELQYNFIDDLAHKGKNYYRLNQFDKDGKNYLSNTVLLNFTGNTQLQLSAYPNPVSSTLNLRFDVTNGTGVVNIYNMEGLKIMSKSVKGLSQIAIDVNSLPAGTYTIEYSNGNEKVRKPFVKIK